jgi:hypothetical protein
MPRLNVFAKESRFGQWITQGRQPVAKAIESS